MQHEIIRQLNHEWELLAGQDISSWAHDDPRLAEFHTGGELIAALPHVDPNPVLRALLELAQSGNPDAGRIILQTMLGKLVLMANCGRARYVPTALDDLVSCMWTRIKEVPLTGRLNNVAARLALDSLRAAQRLWDAEAARPTKSSRVTQIVHLADHANYDYEAAQEGPEASDIDSALVVSIAHDMGWVTEVDAQILHAIYVDGASRSDLAQDLDKTASFISRHHRVSMRTLREHADELVAAVA